MTDVLYKIIFEPWPWYVSGPLLGLIVPLLLLVGNKSFGVSRFFYNTVSGCASYFNINYFKVDLKKQLWNFLFILGVILSGVFFIYFLNIQPGDLTDEFKEYLTQKSISFDGYFPDNYFIENITNLHLLLLMFGGFFVGFGSRYAQGCTSGNAITGLSMLNLGSFIAVSGFFAGGLISTHLILDKIL